VGLGPQAGEGVDFARGAIVPGDLHDDRDPVAAADVEAGEFAAPLVGRVRDGPAGLFLAVAASFIPTDNPMRRSRRTRL
jgi:hypothetical protein